LGEEYKSFSSSLCSLLHSPVTSSLLGPKILLNTLFSNTLSFLSSRNVSDQVSHPYKTTGKIVVLYILITNIMNTKWTDKITKEELWRITHQKSIDNRIKSRKWNWIGHTLRKETGATEKTATGLNPQGYRRRGRPKRTWRRAVEDEISTRRSWNEVKQIAKTAMPGSSS
jgi:hypothetical protein